MVDETGTFGDERRLREKGRSRETGRNRGEKRVTEVEVNLKSTTEPAKVCTEDANRRVIGDGEVGSEKREDGKTMRLMLATMSCCFQQKKATFCGRGAGRNALVHIWTS
jgi:hypothetical protein